MIAIFAARQKYNEEDSPRGSSSATLSSASGKEGWLFRFVILSIAKDLIRLNKILRYAQNDKLCIPPLSAKGEERGDDPSADGDVGVSKLRRV